MNSLLFVLLHMNYAKKYAIRMSLDEIAVTDHFSTLFFWKIVIIAKFQI